MLNVKYNIKGLISGIYECQKKIILNRKFIKELKADGLETSHLELENEKLKEKINSYQSELKKQYQFSY